MTMDAQTVDPNAHEIARMEVARPKHLDMLSAEVRRRLSRGQHFRCAFNPARGLWQACVVDQPFRRPMGADAPAADPGDSAAVATVPAAPISDATWSKASARVEASTEPGVMRLLWNLLMRRERGVVAADAALRRPVVDRTGW